MIPAIYHLEAKVITRGVGRSAVAASAYMSCSEITNEYDGVKHDYTKKGGLVYERFFLPLHAPPQWCDRSKLWNAVEEAEKTRDSRLAREFIVALPVEISRERQIAEAEEFAKPKVTKHHNCTDAEYYCKYRNMAFRIYYEDESKLTTDGLSLAIERALSICHQCPLAQ